MASPFDDPEFAAAFAAGPAQSETEAIERYKQTVRTDPFPEIPAALLNSSDIYNYVAATGMVDPFVRQNLKSASYAIRIGDKAIYWDSIGALEQITLKDDQPFLMPANSIVYIKSKEYFRLPWYIAMRFNLKIMNVHRGILLGTGPVVDPGFEGHLLIPMHNLTTNLYTFRGGETFVWVEFTKVSPNYRWDSQRFIHHASRGLHDEYEPFPKLKQQLTEWDYLYQAYKGPIRSSIPDAMERTRRDAEAARQNAAAAKSANLFITIGGIVALVVGVITFLQWLTPQLTTLYTQTALSSSFEKEAKDARTADQGRIDQLAKDIQAVHAEFIAARENLNQTAMNEVNELQKRIEVLEVSLRVLQEQLKTQNSTK